MTNANWKFGNINLEPKLEIEHRPCTIRGRSGLIVVQGTGAQQRLFPPNEEILSDAIKGATALANKLNKQAKRQLAKASKKPSEKTPDLAPTVTVYTYNDDINGDPTLWVVAQGVLDVMRARTWQFYVARFDRLSGSYNAARQAVKDNRLDEALLWVVDSLDTHVDQLRAIYSYVLPRAVTALKATFPLLSSQELAYCVASSLDKMFESINNVVGMYADAFRQQMDGLYPILNGLRVFLKSTYALFETGDPTGCHNCLPALKTRVFKAGARFLLLAGTDGPATISGGQELLKGPIGVHLGLVNQTEQEILLFELPIYGHENYHNIFWDVEGLASETANKVVKGVQQWAKEEKFNFSVDHVIIGEQKVPILPFLLSVVLQELPEIVADLPGGVMFSGPAYWKSVFQLFIALNAERNVISTDEGLRTHSVFDLVEGEDGTVHLVTETHTPDYPRALLIAEAYRQIGFTKDAAMCEHFANQSIGWKIPEFVEWKDANSQVDWSVKVRLTDFVQLFAPLVKVILFEKMKALGNLSNADIVNWSDYRETKVQVLVAVLKEIFLSGETKLPDDLGDVYPHYLGAALTHVLWLLVGEGWQPREVFNRLNQPALELLLELAARAEAKASETN